MGIYSEIELLPSAARTTTGSGSTVKTLRDFAPSSSARAYLSVSAASGTSPTLDVDIIGVVNGVEYVVASFQQKTAAAKETIHILDTPRDLKAGYAIGGTTPSFTFEVHITRDATR